MELPGQKSRRNGSRAERGAGPVGSSFRCWTLRLREVSWEPVEVTCTLAHARGRRGGGGPEIRGVQGEDGALATARTLESDCWGLHPSPSAYSLVILGKSPHFTPSLSFITCEVGMIVEFVSQGRCED